MRILLIEDNEDHAELIRAALAKCAGPMEVTHVVDLAAGERLLELREPLDVVLLDLTLPDGSGPEVVKRIAVADFSVPVIVLTSLDDDESAYSSLRYGAEDYLVKDRITPLSLSKAIDYAMLRHELFAENKRLVDRLKNVKRVLQRKNVKLKKLYDTAQEFVDNVSHEFRTPLTVIREYASLIRDQVVGPVTAEQVRMLNVVEDRTEDLNTMVDDMLDVSRLGSGVMGIWRKECEPTAIVERILPALERKALLKEVALDVSVDRALPTIFGDDEKIGRVLTNLAVNAIKFCGTPGQVRLEASVDRVRGEVVFSVSDNGQGIDENELREIFGRFRQLEGGARQSCKGFGLGLSIAKELADLNFGELNVQSQVGEGSVFSFSVPVAEPREILRRYVSQIASREKDFEIGVLTATIECPEEGLTPEIGAFLNYTLRPNDLLFRRDKSSWVMVVGAPQIEMETLCERIQCARLEANRNRPLGLLPEIELTQHGHWSNPSESSELQLVVSELFHYESHLCV